MGTGLNSLRLRLFLVLCLALLFLALPLAWLTQREAQRAVLEDLRGALYARLFLLAEEAPPEEEALLAELFRLAQTFGGGVGVYWTGQEARFTQLDPIPLPPGLSQALAWGWAWEGVYGGYLWTVLPLAGGRGLGLALPLEGVSDLGRRLALLYLTWGGGLLLLVFFLGGLGLAWALRPLEGLARRLEGRPPEDLSPLPPPPLAELAPVVGALNRLFRRVEGLLAELREREALARRFAHHASHELRTPLAALKGYLEVLARRPDPRALEGALREAARMEALLRRLLHLARLEAQPLAPEVLDLKAFLAGYGIPLEGEAQVLADPHLLALALENILENAKRHGCPPVRGFLELEGEGVWLWLVDSGPGFPEDLLPRALEPFVHGGKGLGLGLALVAAVARAHGGKARLANRGGAGVGVWLPLASL